VKLHYYQAFEGVALVRMQTPHFPHVGVCAGRFTRTPTAADAGYSLSAYVQISHCVTKVLICKQFCPLRFTRQLTNLET
jgi:hypothetical protein